MYIFRLSILLYKVIHEHEKVKLKWHKSLISLPNPFLWVPFFRRSHFGFQVFWWCHHNSKGYVYLSILGILGFFRQREPIDEWMDNKILFIKNYLTWLWRLTSPKICKVTSTSRRPRRVGGTFILKAGRHKTHDELTSEFESNNRKKPSNILF